MQAPLVFRWEEVPLERVTEMVARKLVRTASHLMRQTYLKRGALVPRRRDAGERLIYVLQGALQSQVNGVARIVREGEVLAVPAHAALQAEAIDDSFVLSVHAVDVVGPGA